MKNIVGKVLIIFSCVYMLGIVSCDSSGGDTDDYVEPKIVGSFDTFLEFKQYIEGQGIDLYIGFPQYNDSLIASFNTDMNYNYKVYKRYIVYTMNQFRDVRNGYKWNNLSIDNVKTPLCIEKSVFESKFKSDNVFKVNFQKYHDWFWMVDFNFFGDVNKKTIITKEISKKFSLNRYYIGDNDLSKMYGTTEIGQVKLTSEFMKKYLYLDYDNYNSFYSSKRGEDSAIRYFGVINTNNNYYDLHDYSYGFATGAVNPFNIGDYNTYTYNVEYALKNLGFVESTFEKVKIGWAFNFMPVLDRKIYIWDSYLNKDDVSKFDNLMYTLYYYGKGRIYGDLENYCLSI